MQFNQISASRFETVFNCKLFVVETSQEVEDDCFRHRAELVTCVDDTCDASESKRIEQAFNDSHGWE